MHRVVCLSQRSVRGTSPQLNPLSQRWDNFRTSKFQSCRIDGTPRASPAPCACSGVRATRTGFSSARSGAAHPVRARGHGGVFQLAIVTQEAGQFSGESTSLTGRRAFGAFGGEALRRYAGCALRSSVVTPILEIRRSRKTRTHGAQIKSEVVNTPAVLRNIKNAKQCLSAQKPNRPRVQRARSRRAQEGYFFCTASSAFSWSAASRAPSTVTCTNRPAP